VITAQKRTGKMNFHKIFLAEIVKKNNLKIYPEWKYFLICLPMGTLSISYASHGLLRQNNDEYACGKILILSDIIIVILL